jgi:hypothetical protein
MTKKKIAVTVGADVLRDARRAVARGRARSLSAYVDDALREKTKNDNLQTLLDEMLAETGGPSTAEERREAGRTLKRLFKGARRRRPRAA